MGSAGRVAVVVALFVAAAVVLFAFMHSGARGIAVCGQGGSSGPGTLSWWPLGTRCSGGFPDPVSWVRFDRGYFAVLWLVVWPLLALLVGIVARLLRRRSFA